MTKMRTLGLTALLGLVRLVPLEAGAEMSQKGINMLKSFEGYSPTNYLCQAKKPTIGYGHVIKKGENFSLVDKKTAENMLRKDVKTAERAVEDNVKVALTKNQYDALASFVYNIGANAFINSTLLRELNSGNYTSAANQFDRWVYAGGKISRGLANRRAEEKKLFLSNP